MSKVTRSAVAALALVAGVGGNALAFLETGTLLTNAASATYMGGGQGTQVTYSATAKILVANPALFMWKDCTPTYLGTVGSSAGGSLVTYVICFSNGGANTAFSLMITDKLPYGVGSTSANFTAWIGNGATITGSYSNVAYNGPWTTPIPASLVTQPAGTWLHWVASRVDIGASGCVSFTLSIAP